MPPETQPESRLTSEVLALVGLNPGTVLTSDKAEAAFSRATKKQLLDCAQRLGMTGISKLSKEQLAARIQSALAGLELPSSAPVDAAEPVVTTEVSRAGTFPSKFDLGRTVETEAMPQNIPWGYGQNRMTAMVVDPERLFVYWEVTDDAVATAREGLGAGGANAWLNLRVYDITGRLFDGRTRTAISTRARATRSPVVLPIGKPTSNACVEIGLKSAEGYFVRSRARGRVDSPPRAGRRRPGRVAERPHGATGPSAAVPAHPRAGWRARRRRRGHRRRRAWRPAAAAGTATGRTGRRSRASPRRAVSASSATLGLAGAHRRAVDQRAEQDRVGRPGAPHRVGGRALHLSRRRPPAASSTTSRRISIRTEGGRVHVVYGPWQVVIRGLGARAERRVLGTWEVPQADRGQRRHRADRGPAPGAPRRAARSGWRSERASGAWLGASELLWRGASELWLLGASEMLLGGASEQMYLGASERRFRGASERLMAGASERLLRRRERAPAGGRQRARVRRRQRAMLGGASERRRRRQRALYARRQRACRSRPPERQGAPGRRARLPAGPERKG